MAKLQDATPANIHFMFVWEVGHNTFAGGLQRLLDLSNNLAEAKVEMVRTRAPGDTFRCGVFCGRAGLVPSLQARRGGVRDGRSRVGYTAAWPLTLPSAPPGIPPAGAVAADRPPRWLSSAQFRLLLFLLLAVAQAHAEGVFESRRAPLPPSEGA